METSYTDKMKFKKWWRVLATFVVVCLLAGEMSMPVMATGNVNQENTDISTEPAVVGEGSVSGGNANVSAAVAENESGLTNTEVEESFVMNDDVIITSGDILASGACGTNLTWTLTQDGLLTIAGTGNMVDFFGDEPEQWIGYHDQIVEVVIEEGVTSIGSYAFAAFSNLKEITLPEGLISIGDYAFIECESLEEIILPDSITSIGVRAFEGCISLSHIKLSINVTSISSRAFQGCESLSEILIPDSVVQIGNAAFYSCSNITDVYYGGSEEQWNAIVFEDDNEDLTTATIHYTEEIPYYVPSVEDAELINYAGSTISYYETLYENNDGVFLHNVVIRLYFSDGTSLDVVQWTDEWTRYINGYRLYTADGTEVVAYDDNNKLPVGEYYLEYTVEDKDFGLRIPYSVCNLGNADMLSLTLDQMETLTVGHIGDRNWCSFTPEESGLYELTTSGNYNISLYDSKGNELSGIGGYPANIQYELEAGKIYYYSITFWDTTSVDLLIKKLKKITNVEFIEEPMSYTAYYELLGAYSYYYRIGGKFRLYFDDGFSVDILPNTDAFQEYQGSTVLKRTDGEWPQYDESGKLYTGDYFIEYTFRNKEFGLKVPYYVRSFKDIDTEMLLDQQENFSVECVDSEVWCLYRPIESGNYKLSTNGNAYLDIILYDSNGTQLTGANGMDVNVSYEMEAGNTYYYCIRVLYDAVSFNALIERQASITSAEIVSFPGETTFYYEFLNHYSWGFSPYNATIRLYLSDGTVLDATFNDGICMEYQIYWNCYKADGSYLEYDEYGKLPIGDYYAEYTVLGKQFGLKIPYKVRSIAEANVKTLSLNELTSINVESVGKQLWCSFTPEVSGLYKLNTSENNYTEIRAYNSKGNDLGYAGGTNAGIQLELEAGETYYYCIQLNGATTAKVLVEKRANVIAATIKSYGGNTKHYSELLNQYAYGFDPYPVVIALKLDDNTTIDVRQYTNAWYEYQITYEYYKADGSWINFDSNGKLNVGEYYVEFSIMGKKYDLRLPYYVSSAKEMEATLTTEKSLSNLLGGNSYNSYFKVEIAEAGTYYFKSSANSTYCRIYDENLNLIYDNVACNNVILEASQPTTYYVCTYTYNTGTYEMVLRKMQDIAKVECISGYPEILYTALNDNTVGNIINSQTEFKVTYEDSSTENFKVYGTDWNRYGFSWIVRNKEDQTAVDSREYSNLPIGEYEILITSTYSDVVCILPFRVTSVETAEILSFDTKVNIDSRYAMYQVNVDKAGAYAIEIEGNSRFLVRTCLAVNGTVYTYNQYSFSGEGTKYIQLKEGINYLYFTNHNAPQNLVFKITRLSDIVKLKHACDDTHIFAYGDWGYSIGESISGNKTYSGKTVSGSTNKRPMVSNSPIDYYVSGNRVSKFNFDITLEAEREDGSIIETFCNSFLWKAYNFIQSILNLDGSPVYTDQNGFVEIGEYIVKYEVGDVEVEIPFSVGESATVKDIRKSVVTFEKQNHTGSEIKPVPNISYAGAALELGKDYTITYTNNIECGTASATIKGINGYSGTLEVDFEIVSADGEELYFSKHPDSVICQVGEDATFKVVVGGNDLKYQWEYSDPGSEVWAKCMLSGYNTDTLTVKATAYRIGMKFRCVVTNKTGESVTSEAAMISLAEKPKDNTPEIVTQPVSQSVELDSLVSFTVKTNEGDYTYQWEYSDPGSNVWAKCMLSGYNTDTLTVKATAYRIGMKFRCVVSSKTGESVTSEAAMISLAENPKDNTPEILTQPVSQSVELDSMVSFTVKTNEGDYTYQWEYADPGSEVWAKCMLSGYNTDTLTVKAASHRIGMKFRCVVTNKTGESVTSEAAMISLAENPKDNTPEIVTQPVSQSVELDSLVSFTVKTNEGDYTYQWEYSDPGSEVWAKCMLSGYNTDTLTVKATAYRIGMKFRCVVTSKTGESVTSEAAMISLAEKPKDNTPEILTQPVSQSVELDSMVSFTVKTNEGDYTYQWEYADPGSEVWAKCMLSGYNTDTLTVKAASHRIGMKFRCVVTNKTGESVTSEAAMISLAENPKDNTPELVSQPLSQSVELNSMVSFTVKTNEGDYTYQWEYANPGSEDWAKCYLNGYATDTLTVKATSYRMGMKFRCVVTGKNGESVTSEAAVIRLAEITESTVPEILSQPLSQSVELNSMVSFTVKTNEGDYTYQWEYANPGSEDWAKCYLNGYATDTLTVKATSYRMGMQFRCVITSKTGEAVTSEAAVISLN